MQAQEQLNEAVRWDLVKVLRRIENGIEPQNNINRLWQICEQESIGFEYLQSFMKQALFYYESTLQRIAASLQPEDEVNPDKIAFILCVNDEADFSEAKLYLQHLYIPAGIKWCCHDRMNRGLYIRPAIQEQGKIIISSKKYF